MNAPDQGTLRRRLVEGVEQLGVTLADGAIRDLLVYLRELERWNRAYNLSGVRDPEAMVSRHVLDSLTVLPWLEGDRVLDLGSGAGLPGLVLAIASPRVEFVLLDSALKKTRFLENMVRTLGRSNVRVVRARAETWRPDAPFPCACARAVASVSELCRLAGPLLAPGGRLILMKGADPRLELAEPAPFFDTEAVATVYVPHVPRKRSLVVLRRHTATDPD